MPSSASPRSSRTRCSGRSRRATATTPATSTAAAAIGEVIATLREQSAAANVAVTMAVEPDLPMLMADLRAVRQMLLNLGSNAIKFTPAGGHVSFAARRDGVGLE